MALTAEDATLEDVLAAARLLARAEALGAGGGDREALALSMLARAGAARVHRRRTGRAHPRYGDGSLAAAAASLPEGRLSPDMGPAARRRLLRGVGLICGLLAEAPSDQAAAPAP